MSHPKPDGPRDTTDPDGSPAENPSDSAAVDDSGGIEANTVNRNLPLIDPAGG